jgi:hypothetical protein
MGKFERQLLFRCMSVIIRFLLYLAPNIAVRQDQLYVDSMSVLKDLTRYEQVGRIQ